ncbi:CLUMA_CG014565, isoform A [Clunio marinus]|uniref:CLUMA_CG014565, isoform A n=1 Tax=Clunio marinus TaxID=568069 RepID=A0A1J1ILT1_9DIPT|nr:CLUMA_CG014565, isoform A [Clunio marinus]
METVLKNVKNLDLIMTEFRCVDLTWSHFITLYLLVLRLHSLTFKSLRVLFCDLLKKNERKAKIKITKKKEGETEELNNYRSLTTSTKKKRTFRIRFKPFLACGNEKE